jgi:glycosyltransferase involved in cell wall biosynthesis
VYLHPAIREPFGFAITEAMMNRVPVAATLCGSTEVLTHQHDGYLLEEGSVEDIETALRSYLADPDRRRLIGERGAARARELLSFEAMWQGHLALYQGALGSPRS